MTAPRCGICEGGKDLTILCYVCRQLAADEHTERVYAADAIDAHDELVAWVLTGEKR